MLLTDGLPTADNSANPEIQALIGGNCAPGSGDGRCLEEIAAYMYNNDLRPTLINNQNATTYTIGFGPEVSGSATLRNTAAGAGGVFYEARDTATLTTVLTSITRDILSFNTSFTAPAVSVNAFNRTQNLNDLYVTVFRPSETYAWEGNIKKYNLDPLGVIEDVTGAPAVEITTGFFRTTAQSYWTTGVDGDRVDLGGAANELPTPASSPGVQRHQHGGRDDERRQRRRDDQRRDHDRHARPRRRGGPGPRQPDQLAARRRTFPTPNGDGATNDQRFAMGDPMNGRPATVIYGGTLINPEPERRRRVRGDERGLPARHRRRGRP